MKSSRPLLVIASVVILLTAMILFFQRGKVSDSPLPGESTASPSSNSTRERPSRAAPREADRMLKSEGLRTDVSLSDFPIKEYRHLSAPSGKPASPSVGEAYIHVPSAGRRVAMESNQLGEFPTIETRLNDTVGLRVSLDSLKPGTPVRVVILDGGSFPGIDGVSQVIKATNWHGIAFEYTTSGNIGTHRILVQAAGQVSRIFDFDALDSNHS